jgi:hypothetical protein
MNKNSGLLSNPLVLGIGGLVIGLLIGWLILGAVALPPTVRVANVDPVDLKQEYKQQWIVDVADANSVTQDLTTARNHLRWFSPQEIQESLRFAFTERNTKNDAEGAARVASFAQVLGLDLQSSGTTPPPTGTTGTSTGGLFDSLGQLLLILAGIILLVALGLFLYMRMRGNPKPATQTAAPAAAAAGGTMNYARPEPVTTAPPSSGFADEPPSGPALAAAGAGAAAATRTATPLTKSLGTFAATYKFGEDNYDTSFTLETARGEFLGETGMGSSETIGEGKPDKVTAFDVWLFDKTDVRTVTQILMSEAAFNDQATRQRLATKGELVLAEKGKHVRLETATLAVDCEIVDLVYASTPGLAPNSHFQKLIVEMVPSQK